MSKTKINDPGAHHTGSGALIRRFLPYLAKYKMTLFLDLFCAALTTLCDIVLPKIMSTITNAAMGVGITLTAGIVLRLAALYFVLRIIDGAASYYMSSIGHIMGVHIETDMRRDAFDHLLKLDHTYYNNTKVGTIMGRITNDLFDVTFLSPAVTSSPGRGKSFLKVGAFGSPRKLHLFAKGSPFGRAGKSEGFD